MYSLTMATAPAAVTTHLSNGLTVVAAALVLFGLYSVFKLRGTWRLAAILAISIVLVVNYEEVRGFGLGARQWLDRGLPWMDGSEPFFTLVLCFLFAAIFIVRRHHATTVAANPARTNDPVRAIYDTALFVLAVLILTASWFSGAIVWLFN